MTNKNEARLASLYSSIKIGKDVAKILDHPAVHAWFDASLESLTDNLTKAPAGEQGHAIREGYTSRLWAVRDLRKSLSDARAHGNRAESQLSASTSGE